MTAGAVNCCGGGEAERECQWIISTASASGDNTFIGILNFIMDSIDPTQARELRMKTCV